MFLLMCTSVFFKKKKKRLLIVFTFVFLLTCTSVSLDDFVSLLSCVNLAGLTNKELKLQKKDGVTGYYFLADWYCYSIL